MQSARTSCSSATSITSLSCVAQITALPASRASSSRSRATSCALLAVMERAVGSSASTARPASPRAQRAIATRCRSPAERRSARWPSRVARPTRSSARRADPAQSPSTPRIRSASSIVLERTQVRHEPGLLRDHLDLTTTHRRRRPARLSCEISSPFTNTRPADGWSRPASRWRSVVFPVPDRPTTAVKLDPAKAYESPSSTGCAAPGYRLDTSSIDAPRTGSGGGCPIRTRACVHPGPRDVGTRLMAPSRTSRRQRRSGFPSCASTADRGRAPSPER